MSRSARHCSLPARPPRLRTPPAAARSPRSPSSSLSIVCSLCSFPFAPSPAGFGHGCLLRWIRLRSADCWRLRLRWSPLRWSPFGWSRVGTFERGSLEGSALLFRFLLLLLALVC